MASDGKSTEFRSKVEPPSTMTAADYKPTSGFKRYLPTLRSYLRTPVPPDAEPVLPIDHVGLWNFCTGSWMTSILWNAYRNGSQAVGKYRCPPIDSCQYNIKRLQHLWNVERQKKDDDKSLKRAVQTFLRTRQIVMLSLFTVAHFIGFFTPMVTVRKLLEFTSDPSMSLMDGLYYVLAIFVIDGLRVFFYSFLWNVNSRTALRLRSALLGLVFQKLVRLQDLGHRSVGEVINIFASDAQRIVDYVVIGQMWVSGTIISVAYMIFVIWVIGLPALSGLTVYVTFYFAQFLAGRLAGHYRRKTVTHTDQRVRLMNQILANIKTVKIYAWEESFEESIVGFRNQERKFLERMLFLHNVSNSFTYTVPIVAAIVTFLTCFALGQQLTPIEAFPVLGAFILSRTGLMILSGGVAKIGEFQAAIDRIQTVLLMDNELSRTSTVPREPTDAICFVGANFCWKSEHLTTSTGGIAEKKTLLNSDVPTMSLALSDIDLAVPKGCLVGICGGVGCGKSSLFSAILGQMHLISGSMSIGGNCAYVSQQAWIVNATIRDNIVFGAAWDQKRYDEVIRCCGLSQDIEVIEGGDMAEIGERGVNLSGGQKQRVSLARAVYADRDIYLLDDPLSAVDQRVGMHIFTSCISNMLASRTVLFVSHQLQYISRCDYVVLMADGRIVEKGSHQNLVNANGAYAGLQRTSTHRDPGEQMAVPEAAKNVVPRVKEHNGDVQRITTDEKIRSGHIASDTYWTYVRCMGGLPVALAIVLTAGAATCAMSFSSWWLSTILNDVSMSANTSNTNVTKPDAALDLVFQEDVVIYGTFLLGIVLGNCIKAIIFVKALLQASTVLHGDMLRKVIRSPMRFFESVPSGRTLNVFSKDLDEVDTVLPGVMDTSLSLIWIICLTLLMIVLVFPLLVIPLSLIVVFYCLAAAVFQGAQREFKRLENASRSPLFGHIATTTQGLSTIHAYNKEADFERQFRKLQDDNTSVQLLLMLATRWLSIRLDTMTMLGTTITALLVVLSRDHVPSAFAGLALTYSIQLSGIVHYLVRTMAEMQVRFTNVERIVHYCHSLDYEESPHDVHLLEVPLPDWPSAGMIVYDNVQLVYRPGLPPALKGVTFTVNPGQKVGIVGRTGSGKSSLGVALFRLVELSAGTVLIDGLDISRLRLTELRSHLSMIPQDPVLFIGTVRYNLDPFEKFTDDDIWNVLDRTNLKAKISAMDRGLLAPVSENGENLSVGERQLLCLARALLRHSKIILLDEATASVDSGTDALIQEILQKAFADCTILTIAHRLHTVLNYDRIMVMDQGKVVEFDTPQKLSTDSTSYFAKLLHGESSSTSMDNRCG